MAFEVFADDGAATVTSGGTTAPAAGTVETWTLSGSTLPAVSSSANLPTQCYVADTSSGAEPEKILVTNISGTSATVTRGADGTTPIAHTTPFVIQQVMAAATIRALQPTAGSTTGGAIVNAATFGAIGDNGTTTNNDVAIQAAINAVALSGGGIVYLNPGTFFITQSLQIRTGVWLQGAGKGVTTIKAKNSFAATQVGSNTGMVMLATYANGSTTVTSIKVTGITFDGNQANIASIPGYSDSAECAPIGLWNCDTVTIEDCGVINAIGYSIYCVNITNFDIHRNKTLSGQTSSTGYPNQDGIHISANAGGTSQHGRIVGNYVDTGTTTGAGDDGIALQTYGTLADIEVSGNMVRAAENCISVPMSGGTARNIRIVHNDIWQSYYEGILIYDDVSSTSNMASDIIIEANNFYNSIAAASSANPPNAAIYLAQTIGTQPAWRNITIKANIIDGWVATNYSGLYAIYAADGTGLKIDDNQIVSYPGGTADAAIVIGQSGLGVTGFTCNGNIITGTTAIGSAIQVEDSTGGTICGNEATGTLGTGSYGVHLLGGTTGCTGIAITGNRFSNFVIGVGESGTASSYNTCAGNVLRGNTTALAMTGTGDVTTGANTIA